MKNNIMFFINNRVIEINKVTNMRKMDYHAKVLTVRKKGDIMILY